MRFPLAAMFFVIASFIFFVIFAVSSLLLGTVDDAMQPFADDLSGSEYSDELSLVKNGFGVMAVLFFVVGILLIFIMDSLADEPEMYWRER